MTLGQKQELFARSLPLLLQYAFHLGYEIRIGHVERCRDCPIGKENSLHKSRLAVDLHLFRDGRYLTETEDHRELGIFWKSLGPDHVWGGDFMDENGRPEPDGNHYSIAHGGMK